MLKYAETDAQETSNLNSKSESNPVIQFNHPKNRLLKALLIFLVVFFTLAGIVFIILAYKSIKELILAKHTINDNFNGTLESFCGKSFTLNRKIRIINGDKAIKNAWPWVVSIRYLINGKISIHYCAGSVITNEHVLTTAHCFRNMAANQAVVIAGLHRLDDKISDQNVYYIKTIMRHLGFGPKNAFSDDIAILKLHRKMKFSSNLVPICLPMNNASVLDKEVHIVGW